MPMCTLSLNTASLPPSLSVIKKDSTTQGRVSTLRLVGCRFDSWSGHTIVKVVPTDFLLVARLELGASIAQWYLTTRCGAATAHRLAHLGM